MIRRFLRPSAPVDDVLAALEGKAAQDVSGITPLLEYIRSTDDALQIVSAGDFWGFNDIAFSEASLRLRSSSRRTEIRHTLELDEAGRGAPYPFSVPPEMYVDRRRVALSADQDQIVYAIVRASWAKHRVLSTSIVTEGKQHATSHS